MPKRTRGVLLPVVSLGVLLAISSSAAADKIKHSIAVFSGLDKITGRIISFEVGMNETVRFGSLLVTDRVCYTRPPTEAPQTDTFVQVDEVNVDKQTKRVFSGWMFAASPGLNALDNPVYDIWLTNCKGTEQVIASPPTTAATPEPDAVQTGPAAPENQAQPASGAPTPPDAAQPAPPAQTTKHHHARHQAAPPSQDNGPIDVGPPPGFRAPPPDDGGNNGDNNDVPPMPVTPPPPGTQPPPDNGF